MKKKIVFLISFIITLVIVIIIFNQKQKNNTIYISDNVNATLLNEVSKKDVTFKSVFPENTEIHEYEFNKKDISNFSSSIGVYKFNLSDLDNIEKLQNTKDLTKIIKNSLLRDGEKYNPHFFMNLKNEKQIFNSLSKYFNKYINKNKVIEMNKKFDKEIKKVSSLTQKKQKYLIYHNAFDYLINDKESKVIIGRSEEQLNDANTIIKILNDHKNNNLLLIKEKGEELPNVINKIINKYQNIKIIEATTFESGLKSSTEYFKKINENYSNIYK